MSIAPTTKGWHCPPLLALLFATILPAACFAQVTLTESDVAASETANAEAHLPSTVEPTSSNTDRLWVISTRHLSNHPCETSLLEPNYFVSQLSCCGSRTASSLEQYLGSLSPDRPVIVYAHGNRLNAGEAISRCLKVYRNIAARRSDEPVDWVLFSWPAAKSGNPIRDARIKADRTDAHGLYLGWLLRQHCHRSIPTGIISYSFGGRITTGALHAMAGGQLDHRVLPGPPVVGAHIDVGLIAPAVDTHWLSSRGYHKHATKNLGQMALLYNRRDAVLKRYWLIDKIRGRMALGFTGPRSFAPRADGTKVSVRARDCARFIGLKHDELDYYQSRCQAGFEMARIVDGVGVSTLSVIE